jgi:hypothetical protein
LSCSRIVGPRWATRFIAMSAIDLSPKPSTGLRSDEPSELTMIFSSYQY